MLFPADRTLQRAEDGVALPDGSLIVADQTYGLRRVLPNGESGPFGGLTAAGYANDPPRRHGAANGVSLEPGGTHLLVTDVLGGGIYRTAVETGDTQLVHRHSFGVNAAIRDSGGAIWFTQSARNTEAEGEAGMFTPVDVPVAHGALWRLPYVDGRFSAPELIQDGLLYANGLVLDELRGKLYVCELAADRVLAFPVDVATGTAGPPAILLSMPTPDNVEQDADGRLWIVSPIGNEVVVVDPQSRRVQSVFVARSRAQAELSAEWKRRGEAGTSRLELLGPPMFAPLPGFLTGVVLGALDGAVYVTSLGDALVRLAPPIPSEAALRTFAEDYAAAWSSQDPALLASFYAERGGLAVNGKPPALGRDAVTAVARDYMTAFPDMKVVTESVAFDGGSVVFRWRWTGTNTGPGGTGRRVDLRGHERWTFSPAGKIALSRGSYDEREYARQLHAGDGSR
jgi:sugar lactone lactonase YvrE